MRPFFGYYGGKWRAAQKNYPPPLYRKIVEPFAGSAGYSVRYFHHDVVLYDADPVIISIWDYLIRVSSCEVLSIPDVRPGERVSDLPIPQEAKWLVGFWVNRGVSRPCDTPSSWMRSKKHPGSFWGPSVRARIASQVGKIRHWRAIHGSYRDCPSGGATWFIDPPYRLAGRHYRHGSREIDYEHLGLWCREQRGQVIVCENEGAKWLPFCPLADTKATRKGTRSREAVWIGGGPQQLYLFGEKNENRR